MGDRSPITRDRNLEKKCTLFTFFSKVLKFLVGVLRFHWTDSSVGNGAGRRTWLSPLCRHRLHIYTSIRAYICQLTQTDDSSDIFSLSRTTLTCADNHRCESISSNYGLHCNTYTNIMFVPTTTTKVLYAFLKSKLCRKILQKIYILILLYHFILNFVNGSRPITSYLTVLPIFHWKNGRNKLEFSQVKCLLI